MANNNDKKVLNVPDLRFPEFSGEWVETELQDIVPNICSGKDRISNSGEVALYGSTGVIGRTNSASYKENIVLVARVGANAGQMQIGNAPCGVTDNTLVIDAKEWNYYIYYFLQHYNLNRLVFGSGQPLITGGMLKRIKVRYGCKAERNNITRLLCLIDERIATQNKIIEKYESLIQAISQKVLRPSEYWNEYRLCELADIRSGYSGNQVSHKTAYAVSRIETISKHRIDMLRVGYVQDIPSEYKLNVGDILFSNINSIQYIGNTAFVDKEYNLYHGMNLLRIIPKPSLVIPRFLHLILCTSMAIKHFQSICNKAVSQASINQTSLGKIMLHIPPLTCQEQICNVFESVEQRLNLEVYYLKRIQLQKNYLLRQMFI